MLTVNRIGQALALAVASLAILSTGAMAQSIDNSDNGIPVAEGSNFRWSFSESISGAQVVNPGDYFTIYDFNGYVPGSELMPAGWSFSAQNTGVTPNIIVTDNPNVMNLTWTRTGAALSGPQTFSGFSALSNADTYQLSNWGAQTSIPNVGHSAGTGAIAVPIAKTSAIPEPGSLALLSTVGLPALAMLRRRKK